MLGSLAVLLGDIIASAGKTISKKEDMEKICKNGDDKTIFNGDLILSAPTYYKEEENCL